MESPEVLRMVELTPQQKSAGAATPSPVARRVSVKHLTERERVSINRTLPPSRPTHWPNSTEDEKAERPLRLIKLSPDGSQDFAFPNNNIKTSKYEIYSFLPKFLLEEFDPRTKIANVYFLIIAALQCIPQISNTSGYPTFLIPLSIILLINGVLAAFEDMVRHRADAAANGSTAHRFDQNDLMFTDCKWSDLYVGDFVLIRNRETIPCDCVILCCSENPGLPPQGMCYVETKQLDGETNLKPRGACSNMLHLGGLTTESAIAFLVGLEGVVEMEHPNKLVDSFTGVVDVSKSRPSVCREALSPNNVLLRGCALRNTDWVVGLVVNTGHDTKIMMSASATPSKSSFLESSASTEIKKIILLVLVVTITGATGQAVWNRVFGVGNIWYLSWAPIPGPNWIQSLFYFLLLHASCIPVSLYVSMSLARSFQTYFMNNDLTMYYEKLDAPAMVRTMTLNEQLGQISHIFSDKTGTLTCNIMDFRKASIAGVSYGVGITEIGKAAWKLQGKDVPADMLAGEARAKANAVPHVAFYCPQYERDILDASSLQYNKIRQFYRTLAICHDVIPERVDGKIKLSASNPDDEALVCAAEYFGFKFCDRKEKIMVIETSKGASCGAVADAAFGVEQWELMETIKFTSKRKRMSVVVRDLFNMKVLIMTKGADTAMLPRLRSGQDKMLASTVKHMETYSTEGLRCLLVGFSEISSSMYDVWSQQYASASSDMKELESQKKGQDNRIEQLEDQLEQGLELLGCTAIEDKLQDGVPECIAQLSDAQIKIWVLTGDKEETAINIAVACNLVLPREYMDQVIINKDRAVSATDMERILLDEDMRLSQDLVVAAHECKSVHPRALIIDGPSLITAMDQDKHPSLREALLSFSRKCRAVVACRVSPDQKRQMVSLIKRGVKGVQTLAVGDGANDVAMIQEAHVGVGIRGEEGLQAVNSADYAIAQFRYLTPLILKHGRYNYIRMSRLVCYIFYKNILMSLSMFWFNFNCGFSGQKYFTEGAIQMFNLIFTSLPILFFAAQDRDIPVELVYKFPRIYRACIDGSYFTSFLFWRWCVTGICESVVISVLSLYFLENATPGAAGGYSVGFWGSGALAYSAIIFVVNLKVT